MSDATTPATNKTFDLFKERRFAPYFLTQFLGAFNDNVFKNSLIILIAFQSGELLGLNSDTLINFAAFLFILPFFLFSATAGQIADKYEKSQLIRKIKLLEIIIMALAALGFYLNSIAGLLAILFLMGAQSSFFGPVKYGILPQHLHEKELTAGNGLIEMGTFLAILLGNILGEKLIGISQLGSTFVSVALVTIAVLGYLASRRIPSAAATDPHLRINWNIPQETWRMLRFANENTAVFNSILAISWFWFLGATYLAQLPNFTRMYLSGDQSVYTLLLVCFSIGIGLGSVWCDRLSGHKIEIGLVPLGAFGMTLFGCDLFFAAQDLPTQAAPMHVWTFLQSFHGLRIGLDMILIGGAGGLFIVPLYALIQQRSLASHRSRVIASNNIMNALFMVVSALFAMLLLNLGLSIPQLFLLVALINALVAIYIFTLVPEFMLRFIAWLLVHTLYRVEKHGLDKIPEQGAAVLVCNHVSFVDALIIMACFRRPIRFVMYYQIFQAPLLRFIFNTAKAIPIAGKNEDPALLQTAFDSIAIALENGELVCIFPEGQITRNGEMNSFRNGIEHIIARTPVPVVPMALQGLWGTFFSRKGGAAMSKLPRSWMKQISLQVGLPVATTAVSANELERQVRELRGTNA